MRNIEDEIDAARAKVAHCRIRAERPGSRLEDDFALEKARNRLLTLELRHLKLGQEQRPATSKGTTGPARHGTGRSAGFEARRTKHEQMPRTARERAEEAFATLRKPQTGKQEVV
ncbi:hypothetical protein [Roseibium sediminicola]|uniref:Transposase n=1 Tax=Roseibium sediminicola TaxID=2933272 RepID=A0ABT0GW05_9HYPH|nr:hypothetical protein [Roseibium sp. CAU 1639]MCK7613622.1 hypothetical protein [Roseibium sp. CAU 1639]